MITMISTCILEDTCVRGTSHMTILWITETNALHNCNRYVAYVNDVLQYPISYVYIASQLVRRRFVGYYASEDMYVAIVMSMPFSPAA